MFRLTFALILLSFSITTQSLADDIFSDATGEFSSNELLDLSELFSSKEALSADTIPDKCKPKRGAACACGPVSPDGWSCMGTASKDMCKSRGFAHQTCYFISGPNSTWELVKSPE